MGMVGIGNACLFLACKFVGHLTLLFFLPKLDGPSAWHLVPSNDKIASLIVVYLVCYLELFKIIQIYDLDLDSFKILTWVGFNNWLLWNLASFWPWLTHSLTSAPHTIWYWIFVHLKRFWNLKFALCFV